jgi:hypothetical protein
MSNHYYKPVGRSLDEMRVAAGGEAKDDEYETRERSAIQNENKPGGSTSFNYGANKKPKLGPKQWKTRTPGNYESEERKAIQSPGKGSTKFP